MLQLQTLTHFNKNTISTYYSALRHKILKLINKWLKSQRLIKSYYFPINASIEATTLVRKLRHSCTNH